MLTPVGLGQVRFTLPGLVPDARGIVTGKELAARFATLDRLIRFLRLLSTDRAPDEAWLGLRIAYARMRSGLRELVVTLPCSSSQAADLVARAARTAGGQCFTGSGKHYAQYRDPRAPLGYDATEMSHEPADLTLYGLDEVTTCRLDGELPLERLLFGLELRAQAGSLQALVPGGDGAALFVTARRGLGPRLVDHFMSAGLKAEAAVCERDRDSAFGVAGAFWIFRVEDLPTRLLGLCARTPGLQLYVPVLDNVAVAAGHAHPLHLEACRAVFKEDRFVLFGPPREGVTVLSPPPAFVRVADLVHTRTAAVPEAAVVTGAAASPRVLELALRLEPTPGPPRAVGAWIPWRQAAWFRRLTYALPSAALRGYRVATLDAALLVIAADDLAGLPFGQPLARVAPGVLVPVGYGLRPALAPGLIAERFGIGEGSYLVFPSVDARPVRVSGGDLEPLDRRLLAQLRVDFQAGVARRDRPPAEDPRGPDLEHEPLGPWPLWGIDR